MKSKVFTGNDTYDLDSQIWRWREANPEIKVLKEHADEQLPWEYGKSRPGDGIDLNKDTVSRRVDYEVTDN